MPSRKSSVFLRKSKPPRKPKYSQKPKIDKSTRPKNAGDVLKIGINEASALGLHIQKLLDTTFAPAPPVLRNYLLSADNEIRDLIKLMITKLGGTPDNDTIAVTASALMEELVETDPKSSTKIAKILRKGSKT